MNLVTMSGYVVKKNKIKKTCKDGDSLTFILEVTTDKIKNKFPCVVFDRLVKRINKAVSINDKVLVHGHMVVNRKNREMLIVIDKLELLDFIRFEDKNREDKKKTKNELIEDKLERTGI